MEAFPHLIRFSVSYPPAVRDVEVRATVRDGQITRLDLSKPVPRWAKRDIEQDVLRHATRLWATGLN